jgi:hypothetical protein
LDESHKSDPWLLDECPRPKSDKSRLNLHCSILEGNSVGSDQEKELKRRAHDLKYQKMQARVQGRVPLKDSI